jgi:hypothetical protein
MIVVGIIIGFLFGCGVGFAVGVMRNSELDFELLIDTDPQPGDIIPGIANVEERT